MKKLFSVLLSLALGAGLTVQAFAAGPLSGSTLAALLAHINWGLTCNHACASSVVCPSEAGPAACPQHGGSCTGYHEAQVNDAAPVVDDSYAVNDNLSQVCPQHGRDCTGYHTGSCGAGYGSQSGGHHGGGHHGKHH